MNRQARIAALFAGIAVVLVGTWAGAFTLSSIVNSKHDLSKFGPGPFKALTEERICVFCHTPHNANPLAPLWNRNISSLNYTLDNLYSSSTMSASMQAPTGPSKLCLSCHDGTIALGQVLQPGTIAMTVSGGLPAESPSYFGASLANHHPVSFSYYDSLPASNPELADAPPTELLFYSSGVMHCTTCHDPHDNTYKKFLAKDGINSGLCTTCHAMNDWSRTPHNTYPGGWNGLGDNPWPKTDAGTDFNWTTVQQNGCRNCHAPHKAGGPRLLNYANEEDNCYPCHNGNVASTNVQADFVEKDSKHQVGLYTGVHDPLEEPGNMPMHVECVDCHNPHSANHQDTPTGISGKLLNVTGVDIYGIRTGIDPFYYASHEYEICFKCHGSSSAQYMTPILERVVDTHNIRVAFQTNNASTHFVAGTGTGPAIDAPSVISPLTASSIIKCTDCHDSDDSWAIGGTGPKGPHGSDYAPLIREQYSRQDPTTESQSAYALCYRCHNRTIILSDDVNGFRQKNFSSGGHIGHLGTAVNAPCSACHDPHGVPDDSGNTGSHTHLINFDKGIVSALTASSIGHPRYTNPIDGDNHAGSCTLFCHGVEHRDETHYYP